MADASMQSAKPLSSRGANPNTDYKVRYLKCKDKYDRVTSEQAEFRANISRASQKQEKLRDEINFLLDAIAAKQAQRATPTASYPSHTLSRSRGDPVRLYASSTTDSVPGDQRPHHAADAPKAYRQDHHADSEKRDHAGFSTRLSPPPPPQQQLAAAGGNYNKRPRPPSADPEESSRRAAEAEGRTGDSFREGETARVNGPYGDAEPQDTPAPLKRPRNH